MAITLKNPRQIEALRAANRLVAEAFDQLEPAVRPGARLSDLDELVTDFIESHGAKALYKGYRGSSATQPPFPGTICASINEEICHGLPENRRLRSGDIIGVDIGLRLNGWCGDACVTYAVGDISSEAQKLIDVTRECLYLGIEAAQPGARLTDIGAAIQAHAEQHGYSVVREWGGHGVGRSLHEEPSVPHVGPAGRGPRLRPGMTVAIEPMVAIGGEETRTLDDEWTVVMADGSKAAHFEHTLVVTETGYRLLTIDE